MILWGKMVKHQRTLRDLTISIDLPEGTGSKNLIENIVKENLLTFCYDFDIERPIWLKKNSKELYTHHRIRFNKDNFIEVINFDYVEIELLEEE